MLKRYCKLILQLFIVFLPFSCTNDGDEVDPDKNKITLIKERFMGLPIKMDCNFCNNLELATHPDKVINMIKSNVEGDYATVAAASLAFVDMILDLSKKSTIITTGSPFLGSLIIHAGDAYDDIKRLNGKISNKTVLALMGDLIGFTSAVPIPQLKALGILGGFSLGIASLLASDNETDIFDSVYDLLLPYFNDMNDMVNSDEELKKVFDCPFIAIPNKTIF